jgi:mono/diheme cytochrome c family protein
MTSMKNNLVVAACCTALLVGVVATSNSQAKPDPKQDDFKKTLQPFTKKHCVSCHNNKAAADNVNFEKYKTLAEAKKDIKVWKKAMAEVMKQAMPPQGMPRPAEKEVEAFKTAVKALGK